MLLSYCFRCIHINCKPAFVIKAHLYLLVNNQYIVHLRLEIGIFAYKIIIGLIGIKIVVLLNNIDTTIILYVIYSHKYFKDEPLALLGN